MCSWNSIWINGPRICCILKLIVSPRPSTNNKVKSYANGKYQYSSEVVHGLGKCRDVVYEEKLTPEFCLVTELPLAKFVANKARTIVKDNILK